MVPAAKLQKQSKMFLCYKTRFLIPTTYASLKKTKFMKILKADDTQKVDRNT